MSRQNTPLIGFAEQAWGIVGASLAINVLALAFPLLMLQIYDRIIPHQSLSTLSIFVLGVLIAAMMEAGMRYCRSYLTLWSSARFEHGAMKALSARMMAEPLHVYELRGSGALTQLFKSISLLKSHQSGQTFQQMLDLPFSLFYVAVVFALNIHMGLALMGAVLLYAVYVFFANRAFPAWVSASQEADLRRGNFLYESLRYIHTVKSMTMEALMLRRHDRLQGQCAKAVTDLAVTIERSNATGVIFMALVSVALLTLGAWLSMSHSLTSGELAACLMLGVRALGPVQRMGTIWIRHQQDRHHKKELLKVLDGPAWSETSSANFGLSSGPMGVVATGLTYQFPRSTTPDLGPLDLSIEPGEAVTIELPSGAGRTVLMQLLAGVLTPSSGQMVFTHQGQTSPASGTKAEAVAYISGASHFFEGTLLQNLTRFDDRKAAQVLDFAAETGLADFVAFLPKGWDTQVGHAVSDTLPQAHRQRISLLRALAKKPRLILIDEPGATLDEAGEALLLNYLQSQRGRVTLVICSDRPDWQALGDRVIRLPGLHRKEAAEPSSHTSAAFSSPRPAPGASTVSEMVWPEPLDERWQSQALALTGQFRQRNETSDVMLVLLKELRLLSSPREIAESAPYFYDSMSTQQLFDTLARLGYEAKPVPMSSQALALVHLPCLVLPDQGLPFVVTSRMDGALHISHRPGHESQVDPASVRGQLFDFVRVQVNPSKQTAWVHGAMRAFKPHIYITASCALAAGVLLAASPLLTMQIYSTVIPSASISSLLTYSLGALLALVLSHLFMRQRIQLMGYLAGRVEYLFGTAIFERILRISPTLSEGASVGAQMARLRSFESIRDFFTTPLASTFLELPVSVFFLILLAWINPWTLLIFACAASVYGLLYLTQHKAIAQMTQRLLVAATERNRFMNEWVSNMRPIRCAHGQGEWLRRFVTLSANATMLNFEIEKKTAGSVAMSSFIMMAAAVGVVAVSTPMVMGQSLSSGALIASMLLMWRVLYPLQTLYTNITRIERIKSAVKQINGLMQIEVEARSSAPALSMRPMQGQLQFNRVAYRYSGSTESALTSVSWMVPAGQVCCITGANGAGKSTLLKLVLRMLPLQNGAILLDGIDIRQHNPTELRRHFGYAPQEIQFFRATILQNLRLARPDASDAEIEQVLKRLHAWDDLLSLKDGLQTRLGDNTQLLGSVLMQKLNLARAIITDAPVLLLDEPLAHLDPSSVAALASTLSDLKGQKTILIMTQHQSLLDLADQLIHLEGGTIRSVKTSPVDALIKS